jgi:hypothetical protein
VIVLAHPRRPAVPAQRGPRGAAGETLIELMVTILIIGTAIVTLLGAISTMIIQSSVHRGQVRVANEATFVAELIQNANYVSCAGASSYSAAYGGGNWSPPNSQYQLTVSTPLYLQDNGGPTNNTVPFKPTFGPTCVNTGGVDLGAQEIKVTVRGGRASNYVRTTLTIVKWRKS